MSDTFHKDISDKDLVFLFDTMKHYIERCKEFPKRGNGLIMVEKRKTKDNQNAE